MFKKLIGIWIIVLILGAAGLGKSPPQQPEPRRVTTTTPTTTPAPSKTTIPSAPVICNEADMACRIRMENEVGVYSAKSGILLRDIQARNPNCHWRQNAVSYGRPNLQSRQRWRQGRNEEAVVSRRDGHTPKTFAQSCVITEMISGVASPR
jgi:hypothetical protein